MSLALAVCLALAASPAAAESFESLSIRAEKAVEAKRPDEALADYSEALALWQAGDSKPAKAKAFAARARLYDERGRVEDALADSAQALRLEPRSARYRYLKGHLELELGHVSTAITELYRATALDLNLRQAYLDRGLAYARQGDLRFAREDYETACRLGLKTGCARAKTLKERLAKRAKPRPPTPRFAAARAPRFHGVEIRRGPPPQRRKFDLRRCRAALDDCVESGLSFGECVSRSRSCPKPCVEAFDRLASDRSEASAFREVFNDGRCEAP